ncbi:response regulator [Chitinophaga sp. YIM B06452]|uniref:response regulator n=1 Tax=Chitinophaga sp. YIM B06452 TaxID=3082158 RepID=UPI0031FED86A
MKVLIIEDDPGWINIITMSLVHFKISYSVVRSGENILEAIMQNKPDLVLLDMLIGYDGIEGLNILQLIKADPKMAGTPVVILSTDYQDQDKEDAIRLGAIAYIRKDRLITELNNFCDQLGKKS